MALTSAERQKMRREKLKEDGKYENYNMKKRGEDKIIRENCRRNSS